MGKILDQIEQAKIIAIVRLDDLSQALNLTQALILGGIRLIEFTLTNPAAIQVIAQARETLDDKAIIGAGSVTTPDQVKQVVESGAQFIVSPVTKPDVIEVCHQYNLPTMPGAYTPTEIQTAWEMDVAAVKVFPASGLGARYIKDVLAPLPHLRMIPTGGIHVGNVADFVAAGAFAVGVGGALCDKKAIAAQDWNTLSNSAKQLYKAIS